MRIAVGIGGPSLGGADEWQGVLQFVLEAEALGVDSCWTAEAWGQDAVAPLAYVAARTERIRIGAGVMQISARVPAVTAMTAMTLATISGNRFSLGLGVSGPRVVEALHGVPFDKPFTRLTEYLDVLDLALAGAPLDYSGETLHLPLEGSGLAPFRLAHPPTQPIPVYLAALGPRALRLTGSRADGWLASGFIPEAAGVFLDPMRAGAAAAGRDFATIDLQAGGPVAFGDDVERLLQTVKQGIAFRLGAMGSGKDNFYNQAYQRAGYAEEALTIQRAWVAGERDRAVVAVTDEMAIATSFVGSDDMVRARIRAFRDAGITTLWPEIDSGTVAERVETLGRFVDLARSTPPTP